MDNRRMLFLINPHAGKAEIKGKALDLIDLFVRGGWEVTVHTTQRRLEIADLLPRRAGQYGLIVCSGGDGTLNETITGLMRCLPEGRPPVGYIPAGTVNDFASSLGISKNMHEAAATILSGEPFLCDVGAFGDRYFSYIAAFGAFTDVSYQTPQQSKTCSAAPPISSRPFCGCPPSRPTACPSPTTARRSRANSSSAWSPTPPRSAASSSGRARTSR